MFLLSGSVTSAGKADRSAPTAPTSLTVTSITETTATLSWGPSTDNSGKFSYKLRINNLSNSAYNSLATISQSQTTYTAKYLATNSPYSFTVYAVDGSGNTSADSNTVNASTPADTTAPSTPVLGTVVLGPSEVQLTWTKAFDNVNYNCCNYGINVNGGLITENINWTTAPPDKLSAVIRHLSPATTYAFSITASEYSGGNAATSNVVNATTDPSSDTTPPTIPANLHLVSDNGCAEVWLGWTQATDNVDPQSAIEYEIYVNGVVSPLPVSSGIDLDFVYGTAFGDNVFYIKAVDRTGNRSAASGPLKLFLWPC